MLQIGLVFGWNVAHSTLAGQKETVAENVSVAAILKAPIFGQEL